MKLYAVRTNDGPTKKRMVIGVFYARDPAELAVMVDEMSISPRKCEFKTITRAFGVYAPATLPDMKTRNDWTFVDDEDEAEPIRHVEFGWTALDQLSDNRGWQSLGAEHDHALALAAE